MFGMISAFAGSVDIKEENNIYTIKANWLGVSKRPLIKLLGKEEKIKHLFHSFSLTECVIDKFFIPDFLSILEEIPKSRYSYGVKVNVIDTIKEYFKDKEDKDKDYVPIDYKEIDRHMSFKILKHQEPIFEKYEYFKKHLHYRGMLLDAEPGTGKTFSSLALCTGLKAEKVIIICPLPTVEKVWVKSLSDENENVFKEPQEFFRFDKQSTYNHEKYIICHYEALGKLESLIKTLKGKNVAIIIDESHNLNEVKSKRTQYAIDIINAIDPENVFLLSGTPLKSGYREMSPLLRFLDPSFNKQVEDRFFKFYKAPNNFVNELLKKKYGLYSVKVTKTNIGLPEIRNMDLNITLPGNLGEKFKLKNITEEFRKYIKERTKFIKDNFDEFYRIYNDLLELAIKNSKGKLTDKEISNYRNDIKFVMKLDPGNLMQHAPLLKKLNTYELIIASYLEGKDKKIFMEYKTIVKYPSLKVQGEALGKIVTGSRIECHREMARHIQYNNVIDSTRKKTIIFSNYISVCDAVVDTVKKMKYKPTYVYGEHTKNLSKSVTEFTKVKNANPMVASYKSLSTGVPLIVANVVLCLDLPFRMYNYEQAIARVWRLGQDEPVTVYKAVLNTDDEPNINSRNIDIIKYFKDEIEKITGYKYSLDLDSNTNTGMEDYFDLDMENILFKNVNRKYIALNEWSNYD